MPHLFLPHCPYMPTTCHNQLPAQPCRCTVPRRAQDKVVLASLLCKYTVVLTTYGTLAAEAPPKGTEPKQAKQQGGGEGGMDDECCEDGGRGGKGGGKEGARKKGGSTEGGPLYRIRWHRVILDEAQVRAACRSKGARVQMRLSSGACLGPLQRSGVRAYSAPHAACRLPVHLPTMLNFAPLPHARAVHQERPHAGSARRLPAAGPPPLVPVGHAHPKHGGWHMGWPGRAAVPVVWAGHRT